MVLALRHPRVWLCLGWALVAVAVVLNLLPISRLPQPPGLGDKVEHMLGYAALALWFAGIYPRSRYGVIAVSLFAMGIVIEGLQGAMHVGRHADLRDVLANTLGILAGLALALAWLGGWAQRLEALVRRR